MVWLIFSDCPAVTGLNDSGPCSGPSISIPVSSDDVGNVQTQNTANLCTNNSASSDSTTADLSVVGDKQTEDGQRSVTSVSTVSNTTESATSTLGEHDSDDALVNVVNKTSEDTEDTDLAAAASSNAADSQNVYHVKWIKFRGSQTPIVMQNQNGPCPLLAIVNVLLLQGKIKLSSGADLVASDQLMAYIADWIFDNVPKVSE